jgi:energy-coupling factor transport system ATP-binding protein
VTDTVFEECVRADKLAGIPAGTALTQLTFFSLLERHHGPAFAGEQILSTHPRDLSAGTQLALAIAVQSSWKPAVLLVDEPSRGLDPQARLNAAEVLACVAETGTAVMCATHYTDFAEQISHRILRLNDGRITSVEVMQP